MCELGIVLSAATGIRAMSAEPSASAAAHEAGGHKTKASRRY